METEQYLDQQRDKLIPEHDSLKKIILAGKEVREEMAQYILSDKFMKDSELSELRQSSIVLFLSEISLINNRSDGWTPLTTAGQMIHQYASKGINDLNKKYNYKTLKGLILATEVFDLKEEPTKKGGIRVLYRLKSNWELTPPTEQIGLVRNNKNKRNKFNNFRYL